MSPKDQHIRSFTNDVCDRLRSDRANRRTRKAERKLEKALRRAEAKERHQQQVQLMASELSKATAEVEHGQRRVKHIEDTVRVIDTLERVEHLVNVSEFADPEVADLLKTVVMSENRTHAATGATQSMRVISCNTVEDAENMVRGALSEALQHHMAALRTKFSKMSVASDSTQTEPSRLRPQLQTQEHSIMLATKRTVLSAQQSSCSQPELKQVVIDSKTQANIQLQHDLAALQAQLQQLGRNEAAARATRTEQDSLWMSLRRGVHILLARHAPGCRE
eukprot:TRINITY_DN5807_c2_g3_i2.p1 TRINITY_DN5807_c2_g3~~TRINITY_DN5807_c2_g3_i2.p1  ORF type:complete len:303 (+),score=96.72 TRINITY_DN5807_c2_g3_i2:78-911(+)